MRGKHKLRYTDVCKNEVPPLDRTYDASTSSGSSTLILHVVVPHFYRHSNSQH